MNIIPIERVTEKTSLGRSTIYHYMRSSKFPPAVRLGERHVGWVEAEVDAWLRARIEERSVERTEEMMA
jgi:prophage regulatory protein